MVPEPPRPTELVKLGPTTSKRERGRGREGKEGILFEIRLQRRRANPPWIQEDPCRQTEGDTNGEIEG